MLFVLCQVSAEDCSQPCDCPAEPPVCYLGTSLVLDGCGCCKVCARQGGEPCSLLDPCDHHKELYCNYNLLSDSETGICMGECLQKILHCHYITHHGRQNCYVEHNFIAFISRTVFNKMRAQEGVN